MAKKRETTPEEKLNAQRLKSIWTSKKSELGMTQDKLGEKLGMSQSAITQYLNGVIPLNLEAIMGFCSALHCLPSDIDPELTFSAPLTSEELMILESYRKADDKGKKLILGAAVVAPHQKEIETQSLLKP